MSDSPNILELNEVSKSFYPKGTKVVLALDKISFAIKKGSISALVGPDGAGKSTLLRVISGLLAYDSGSIFFQAKDYSVFKGEQRNFMAYMPQKFGLYEDLTVQENLDLYADLRSLPLEEREKCYERLLTMTALDPFRQRLAGNLSGGMKQKLGLICTLVRPPDLLLLDEPTVGVDPLFRRELWEIIDTFRKETAMTVLLSTSNMLEAEKCDEILLLFKGRSLAKGKPKEIEEISSGMAYLAKAAENDKPRALQNRLLGFSKIIDTAPQSSFVRFVHEDLDEKETKDLDYLLGGARVKRVKSSLEDSFMLLLNKAVLDEKTLSSAHLDRQAALIKETSPALKDEVQLNRQAKDEKEARSALKEVQVNGQAKDEKTLSSAQLDRQAALMKETRSALKEVQLNRQAKDEKEARSALKEVQVNEELRKKNDSELPIVESRNVSRFFGDFIAVNNVSFSVYRGEVFGLLGPNGAGKTTTFRMLCGLLPASKGELYVDGVDVRKARREARQHLAYVAQKFSLYSPLSVRENLDFFAGAYGLKGAYKHERIAEVADEFSLKERLDMAAGDLPGGYRQRLSMAVALLHKPAILFLDEPTSGADPLARRSFWKRIYHLAESGVTIIVTTHFMEEAEYCDRILIQDKGLSLALGTPEEIRSLVKAPPGELLSMEDAFIGIVEKFRAENK